MEEILLKKLQFTGSECTRTLDSKNRIVMPPAFKDGLKEKTFYVICFPDDNYLRVYNEEDLDSILDETLFSSDDEDNLSRQRYVLSRMIKCELDAQNRFTITQKLIDLASISKEVIMVGAGTRIELWNPALYEEDLRKCAEKGFAGFRTKY